MVKDVLVNELVVQGAALLRELDRQRFPVEAMFWVQHPDQGYWRLVIASSLVTAGGPAPAYRKLDEICGKTGPNGPALSDISLLEPDSQEFRDLLTVAEHSALLAVGPSWVVFNDAIVYRWNSVHLLAELDCDVSEERLEQLWETERKLGKPRLLFSSAKRSITIRLHPAHGPRFGGLKNIKQDFQIALHRPNGFPRCKVSWLN